MNIKKNLAVTIILIFICFNAFAGNIYSSDENVALYIKVTEMTKDNYSFALCDENGFSPCSQLGKGFLVQKNDVLKLAKKFKRKSYLNGSIVVATGIVLIAGGGALGLGCAAAVTAAVTESGLAAVTVGAAGAAAGIGAGIAGEVSIVTKLRPGSYKRLGNALEEAMETDERVIINQKDIYGLSTILDEQLLKFL